MSSNGSKQTSDVLASVERLCIVEHQKNGMTPLVENSQDSECDKQVLAKWRSELPPYSDTDSKHTMKC